MNKDYENQILALKAEGKNYKEIMDILGCSESIIHYHFNPDSKKQAIKRQSRESRAQTNDCRNAKGGRCEICGYNSCFSALEFHHLDPSQKDFGISEMKGCLLETLVHEVNKCALLCCNCHREVHEGILDIGGISFKKITEEEIEDIKRKKKERVECLRPEQLTFPSRRVVPKEICRCGNPKTDNDSPLCYDCFIIDKRKNWPTREKLKQVLDDYQHNKNRLELTASYFNVTPQTIVNWCAAYHLKRSIVGQEKRLNKKKRRDIISKEDLVQLLKEKPNLNQIRVELGITRFKLISILKDYNLEEYI